jgi:hypothetical protein
MIGYFIYLKYKTMPNKSIGNAILKAIPFTAVREVSGYYQQAQEHSLVENVENVFQKVEQVGGIIKADTGGFSGPFGAGPVPAARDVLEEMYLSPIMPSISTSNKGLGIKFGSLNVFHAPSAHQIALDTAQVITKVVSDPNEALNEVGQQVQDAVDVVEQIGQDTRNKLSSMQVKAPAPLKSIENDIQSVAQNIIHPNFLHFVGF